MEHSNMEKRKAPRVTTHIPVKYHQLGSPEKTFTGSTITKNLSEGGVRFRTQNFVSRACRLILELDLPMFNNPIRAISKVAWIRKTVSGEDYELGNQFLEISKKDKELVSEYVNSLILYNDPEVEANPFAEGEAKSETK